MNQELDLDLNFGDEAASKPLSSWMLTFADLMALLLIFFVLLLSFSTLDLSVYKELMGSLKDAFGVQRQIKHLELPGGQTVLSTTFESSAKESSMRIVSLIRRDLSPQIGARVLEVDSNKRGIVIRLEGTALFDPGSAELRADAEPVLDKMLSVVEEYSYPILVEGHTDNLPICTAQFPSNWELSTARAGAVVRYFVENGSLSTERLAAIGYADTRPVGPNDSPENRSRNRRVEILLLTKGSDFFGER